MRTFKDSEYLKESHILKSSSRQ